jgi:glycosyltransferase-like protein
MTAPRRIAFLTHSTNPRGGVSHCLSLAEALTALGHEAVVHAPDPAGRGFFRAANCGLVALPATPLQDDSVGAMVLQRIADYRVWFDDPRHRGFDIYHAHDGIGGNALADLREVGQIPRFLRTVHHLDTFKDERIASRQIRAVRAADAVFCVSDHWVETLARDYGIRAHRVTNGVDPIRFSPIAAPEDAAVAERFGFIGPGPLFLSIGGFEARKNSLSILEAFAALRKMLPSARLAVVGGASVLDHAAFVARCRAFVAERGLDDAVVAPGPVPQEVMPALYRLADALVFPSLNEGFGLAVVEAMASGTPVIASAIPPFTEYLSAHDALLVDPADVSAITGAMRDILAPEPRRALIEAGLAVARRFDWRASAERHLELYAPFCEFEEAALA